MVPAGSISSPEIESYTARVIASRTMRVFAMIGLALLALTAHAQTTIRMMAGLAFGIPPKEATTTAAQVRRAVFEQFHKQNPDIRVVNACS
jgi:hypothetical protein